MIHFEQQSDIVQGVTPSLAVRDADAMIDFYQRAFGAEVNYVARVPTTRHVMHASISIGGYAIYLHEIFPDGCQLLPFKADCREGCIHLQLLDGLEEVYATAVAAGATVVMPPTDMFWGDRFAVLKDPCGHQWTIAVLIPHPPKLEVGELLGLLGLDGRSH